jgi:hypothetical protein
MKNETPNLSARGMENARNVTMPNTEATVKTDETSTSSEAQRKRLLEALQNRSLTTLEARRELDVMHPAARIMELRKKGHDIQTVRVPDLTREGFAHNVARYILRQSPGEVTE